MLEAKTSIKEFLTEMTVRENMEYLMMTAKTNLLLDKKLAPIGIVITQEGRMATRSLDLSPERKEIERITFQVLIRGLLPKRAFFISDAYTKRAKGSAAEALKDYHDGDLAKDPLATECISIAAWDNWETYGLIQPYLRDRDNNISFVGEPEYLEGGECAFFPDKPNNEKETSHDQKVS